MLAGVGKTNTDRGILYIGIDNGQNYCVGFWGYPINNGVTWPLNTYHVLAATYAPTGTKTNLYCDGKRIITDNTSSTANIDATGGVAVGCIYDPGDGYWQYQWNGSTDFAIVYSRTLTPEEVRSISNNPWQIYEPETVWLKSGQIIAWIGV